MSGLVLSVAFVSVVMPRRDASACGGTIGQVPPTVFCSKTLVMSKASPIVFVIPPAGVLTVAIPVTVFCRSGPTPGEVCNAIATPVSATGTMSMFGPLLFPPPLPGQWGQVGSSCDFDGGGVGITDFLALLGQWGPCP